MKKIFWTTIFWIVVVVGFAFYVKLFNPNIAAGISTWLGVTTITTSGEAIVPVGTGEDINSKINSMETMITDIQAKLNVLVAPILVPTPIVETTGSVDVWSGTK